MGTPLYGNLTTSRIDKSAHNKVDISVLRAPCPNCRTSPVASRMYVSNGISRTCRMTGRTCCKTGRACPMSYCKCKTSRHTESRTCPIMVNRTCRMVK